MDKWDKRFLGLAEHIAQWSKDPSTKVGAVIVKPDRTIVSTGYNGFPRSMSDDPDLYADRDIKYSRIIHAEVNAILSARGSIEKCTLYTWPFPTCDRCSVLVIQAGISRVVAPKLIEPRHMDKWGPAIQKSETYYKEAGVAYQWM